MNDTPVSEDVCRARQQINAERMGRDKERLDKSEELLHKVSECQIEMASMVKAHEDKLANHEKRIDEIERRPANWLDKIIAGVISAVVAFLVGVVLK